MMATLIAPHNNYMVLDCHNRLKSVCKGGLCEVWN